MRGFGGANKLANAQIDAAVEAQGKVSKRQKNSVMWAVALVILAIVTFPVGTIVIVIAGVTQAVKQSRQRQRVQRRMLGHGYALRDGRWVPIPPPRLAEPVRRQVQPVFQWPYPTPPPTPQAFPSPGPWRGAS